jgi:hypothetical protein
MPLKPIPVSAKKPGSGVEGVSGAEMQPGGIDEVLPVQLVVSPSVIPIPGVGFSGIRGKC